MEKPWSGRMAPILSGLAVFASLLFVGYELKRNNDYAVVQGQYELLALNTEMKSWLTNPHVIDLLMREDFADMSAKEKLLFTAWAGGWFDLYELAFIAWEKGVITSEQMRVWKNGLCTLPPHWFDAFQNGINADNFVIQLVEAVDECRSRALAMKPDA